MRYFLIAIVLLLCVAWSLAAGSPAEAARCAVLGLVGLGWVRWLDARRRRSP
jgi:hypothetical protein